MKGILKNNLPVPRYNTTWDVSPVLSYSELPTGVLKDYGLGINFVIFPKSYIHPLTL